MSNYGYDYDAVGAAAGGLAAGFFIVIGLVVLVCLAIAVVQIIGTWKILVKGGKPGWGALIPIYNTYLLCDMVGVWPWWILIVFVGGMLSAIPIIGSLLSIAISIYFSVLLNVSLARAFGKEDSYAVGLILLSPVFYSILGFGKAEFKGKNPMNDIVMEKINGASANSNNNSQNSNTKFCTSCGGKMDKNSSFCPSCGKEVK